MIKHSSHNSSYSFVTSSKIVFSNWKYLSLAVVISVGFWLFFAISDQLLFFSPSLAFYWPLPTSSILPFTFSTLIACLIGLVVSINMRAYISIRGSNSKREKGKGGGQEQEKKNMSKTGGGCNSSNISGSHQHRFFSMLLSGSSLGVITGACAGCSFPLGSLFASLSVLSAGGSGIIGASFVSFVSIYHWPIQLISIGLLIWSYYYSANKILVVDDDIDRTASTRSCGAKRKDNDNIPKRC
jgi:hypothetical protein